MASTNQLDTITQQNAAMFQQTSEATKKMLVDCENLSALLASFELNENQGGGRQSGAGLPSRGSSAA